MVLPYLTLQIAALPLEANNNTTTGTSNEPPDPPKKSSTLPPMSSAKYTGMYAQQVRPKNPPRFHPCLLPSTQVCTPNRSAQEILHASTRVFCQVHRYVRPTGPPKKSFTLPPMSSAKHIGMYTQQDRPRYPPRFHPYLVQSTWVWYMPNRSAQEILQAFTRVFCQVHRYIYKPGSTSVWMTRIGVFVGIFSSEGVLDFCGDQNLSLSCTIV